MMEELRRLLAHLLIVGAVKVWPSRAPEDCAVRVGLARVLLAGAMPRKES